MHRPNALTATLIAGTVALALLAAACGGGGNDDSAPPGSSKEELSISSNSRADAPAPGATQAVSVESFANSLAGGTNGGLASGSQSQVSSFDRKIIFTTSLDLSVPDVTNSFNEAQRLARVSGGYVEKSNLSVRNSDKPDEPRYATVTLRVPVAGYDDFLNSLRTLPGGKITREEAKSNEVTEQYTDLQSRLRNLERTETQYLELLKQAKTIAEILTINDRLDGVRSQIEQAQGRIKVLDHLTELATVQLALAPIIPAQVKDNGGLPTPAEAFVNALEWSAAGVYFLAVAGSVASVALIWLIPVAALALIGRRFVWGRR